MTQAQLKKRGLTTRDLGKAIARFQKSEKVRVGTLIGVNEDGFFGSTDEGWTPDRPGAFDEPLLLCGAAIYVALRPGSGL